MVLVVAVVVVVVLAVVVAVVRLEVEFWDNGDVSGSGSGGVSGSGRRDDAGHCSSGDRGIGIRASGGRTNQHSPRGTAIL